MTDELCDAQTDELSDTMVLYSIRTYMYVHLYSIVIDAHVSVHLNHAHNVIYKHDCADDNDV